MEMSTILNVVQNERERIVCELDLCIKSIEQLPKGQVYTQSRGSKTYHYLKFRDGPRVVSRYLDKNEILLLRSQIADREALLARTKALRKELAVADRILSDPVIAKIITK